VLLSRKKTAAAGPSRFGVAVPEVVAAPPAAEPETGAPSRAAAALVARRPILDLDGFVRGHELAFGEAGARLGLAELAAAARELSGSLPAWFAATGPQLVAAEQLPAGGSPLVIQLAADEPVDGALLARLRRLRGEGHGIALMDGLSTRRDHLPLWSLASHVMIDLSVHGPAGLEAAMRRRSHVGPRIVAANVDTPQQRDGCARIGVDLVQGFHFERPRPHAAAGAAGASVRRLRTLLELRERPAFENLETIIGEDPGLTVRLLRFANSAAVSAGRTLDTVRDAMMVLGAEQVRRFVLSVLLGDLGAQRPALVAAGLLRGRLCETLVRDAGAGDPDAAFTAGILSVADALLDQPMGEVVRSLPVGDELQWALVTGSGPLGAALATAVRLERHRDAGVHARFTRMHEVVAWADDAVAGLAA
jgi:EAL and modified HD-GYP domain-containing signal transduction protein